MFRKFFAIFIILCIIQVAYVHAADKKRDKGKEDVISKIVEKAIGNELIRTDKIEPSHIEGWKQMRIWVKSTYGERPYLIYTPEDKNLFIIGSVFNGQGDNLTEANVGKIKPKIVLEEKMNLHEDFRIGPENAEVRTVLWIGTDSRSKYLFNRVYNRIYLSNKEKMNIYIKFFPKGDSDYRKMEALTCFKGETFESALKTVLNALDGWGDPKNIKAFKEKRGVTDNSVCNEKIIRNDLELAAKLYLPYLPVIFVNGEMFLENINAENFSKVAGVPLK